MTMQRLGGFLAAATTCLTLLLVTGSASAQVDTDLNNQEWIYVNHNGLHVNSVKAQGTSDGPGNPCGGCWPCTGLGCVWGHHDSWGNNGSGIKFKNGPENKPPDPFVRSWTDKNVPNNTQICAQGWKRNGDGSYTSEGLPCVVLRL